jgi:hypothetical protein
VTDSPEENWRAIHHALRVGTRGLPGGTSLAQLLTLHRGHRNLQALPALTEETILKWADAQFQREGQWPKKDSGPIQDAPGETWSAVNTALVQGLRGLEGGTSLLRLLSENRGVRHRHAPPPLTLDQVLEWADQFRAKTGGWPTAGSGAVEGVAGETWFAINQALRESRRGLDGRTTLAQLLREHRMGGRRLHRPALSVEQILAWADAYYTRQGRWPTKASGRIPETEADTWKGVDQALVVGLRGLNSGSSLARMLREHRPDRAW